MENSIKKTGAILLLIMALIGMTRQSKGQEIKKYNKAPQNDKFVGTYTFDDGKQSLVIKLIKKPDVYIEKLDIYLDMIEGTVEYKKNNEVIMRAGTEPQIINGGVPPSTPNSMIAVFSDKRSGQRGTVTIDLNPQDSTIVFKLKKIPRGVIINNNKSVYDVRPFTIPTEITLKRKEINQDNVETVWILKYKEKEGFITDRLIFNTKDVKDLYILSNAEAVQQLGEVKHKRVAMKVTFDPSVKLLNREDLFSLFNVNTIHRGFPLQIDGEIISDPSRILVAENALYSLKFDEQHNIIKLISKDYQKGKETPIRTSNNEVYIK